MKKSLFVSLVVGASLIGASIAYAGIGSIANFIQDTNAGNALNSAYVNIGEKLKIFPLFPNAACGIVDNQQGTQKLFVPFKTYSEWAPLYDPSNPNNANIKTTLTALGASIFKCWDKGYVFCDKTSTPNDANACGDADPYNCASGDKTVTDTQIQLYKQVCITTYHEYCWSTCWSSPSCSSWCWYDMWGGGGCTQSCWYTWSCSYTCTNVANTDCTNVPNGFSYESIARCK